MAVHKLGEKSLTLGNQSDLNEEHSRCSPRWQAVDVQFALLSQAPFPSGAGGERCV